MDKNHRYCQYLVTYIHNCRNAKFWQEVPGSKVVMVFVVVHYLGLNFSPTSVHEYLTVSEPKIRISSGL